MKEIQSVLLVGAGAVGTVVAGIIATHRPQALSVLADGERIRRYRADGFIINGSRRDFTLVTPRGGSVGDGRGGGDPHATVADLVIVTVKNHHLPRAIENMRGFVGKDTLILSLLNGISSEEMLAAAFGEEKVPYAMILGIDAVREGNSTRFTTAGKIHFGDAVNTAGALSERVSRIAAFFDLAGVAYVIAPDMVKSLWYKFMINVGVNQVSAVIRAPYGAFQTDPGAKSVMEAAMAEVVAVSKAMGTGLQESDISAWYTTLNGLGPNGKTSMLQDVEAKRKTEVEAFAGKVIELGRAAGVGVPVNTTLYNLITAIERGY